MSPFQWACKLFKGSNNPSSSSFHKGLESSERVRLHSLSFVNSPNRSLSTQVVSAPEYCQHCQIYQRQDISYLEVPPRNDYIPTPYICIACVEQLSQAVDTGETHPEFSSWNSSPSPSCQGSPDNSRIFFCIICVGILPESKFPDERIAESCKHEPNVCIDCIEKSIVESLDNDLPQIIGCPQCGVTMSATDVWRFSETPTYQRFERMLRLVKEQECIICIETLRVSEFPEARVTDKCSHEPNTCLECISHHIQSQLESRRWDQLSCPECPALLRYVDVQKYAAKQTFQKYDFLTMKNTVSSDPNFRWCTAAGCNSGQVHQEGAESPLIICNSCREMSCFIHQSPWHSGMTCLEIDNPQTVGNTPVNSPVPKTWEFLSRFGNSWDRNCEITVGGVRRKETDQERRDRQLAMRISKQQEEEEKNRLRQIKQRDKQRVEAAAAEQREFQRHAHEEQGRIERNRKEQERQAQEGQKLRVRRQKEESASKNLLQTNTKACPGTCGWRIQKIDGCDHMTC